MLTEERGDCTPIVEHVLCMHKEPGLAERDPYLRLWCETVKAMLNILS